MKANVGTLDRIIRIVAGAAIGLLYWQGLISGTLAIILGVVAAIFIVTGFMSYCPAYGLLGWRTIKAKLENKG